MFDLIMVCVMQIPRLEARLTTFLTKFEAREMLSEAKGALEDHLLASSELCTSACFAAVLEEVLTLGNFLNHGMRLGQAAGFRLKTLPKLQVRSCHSHSLHVFL